MKRKIIGVSLGALVFFVWGSVSWMKLPLHDKTMKALPEEQLIRDTLKVVVSQPGLYFFPSDKVGESRMSEKEWKEKFVAGPSGLLIYSLAGKDPMPPAMFLFGLLGDLALAAVCMTILVLVGPRVKGAGQCAMVTVLIGFASWLSTHLPYWNWFNFPGDYTLVALFDQLVGFGLMGLVMSRFAHVRTA